MPIPLIDTTQHAEVYCVADPAIDTDKSDIKAYGRTLDPSHLVLKPGMFATRFVVHAISPQDGHQIMVDATSNGIIPATAMATYMNGEEAHFRKGIVGFRGVDKPDDYILAETARGREIIEAIPYVMRNDIGGLIKRLGEGVVPPEGEPQCPSADPGN
jgi:hypothetical protein